MDLRDSYFLFEALLLAMKPIANENNMKIPQADPSVVPYDMHPSKNMLSPIASFWHTPLRRNPLTLTQLCHVALLAAAAQSNGTNQGNQRTPTIGTGMVPQFSVKGMDKD